MAYELDNVKVLIVDDTKPFVELTKSVLQSFGFKNIHIAYNGEEGFKQVQEHNPDFILTDWIMDPVDGLEFTKMVRTDPLSPNPYVPIVMTTGFSSKLRVEEARDTGITEFLVKPFTAKDLYARIFQIIEKPRQFVDADEFFGPDRRRKMGDGYEGPRRREDDSKRPVKTDDDKASDILKKLSKDVKEI